MSKFFLSICCVLLLFAEASAQNIGSFTITLKQAVETAIKNNINVKQAALLADAAQINKRQARMNMLPELNASIIHGINQGRSIDPFTNSYINQRLNFANYNLGSGIVLFNGFRLQHLASQSALSKEASDLEWEQAKEKITIDIILAYLQVLSAQEQLKASVNQAAITTKQVERLQALHREGAIAPSLLYDLQGQLANDQLAIVNNQNNLNAAKLSLCQLMNIPYDKRLTPEPISTGELISQQDTSPETLYEQASASLSVLKATSFRRQAATLAVKSARAAYSPLIVVNANLFTNYSSAATRDILLNTVEVPSSDFVDVGGTKFPVIKQRGNFNIERISYMNQFENNYSNSLSVGLRVPLFNGLRSRNQVALAKIDLKKAEYLEEASQVQLKQQVEQAYFNMAAARDRYNILNEQLVNFSASYRAAETRFNAGVSNQVEYLIAKNNLDKVNINLINARYDYVLRVKVLDYYQGRLVL